MDEEGFNINFQKIISEKSLLSITRMLAADMSNNPYITVGSYLKSLSAGDLQQLIDIIDEGEDHANFQDLMLIAGMLSLGEGIPCSTLEE